MSAAHGTSTEVLTRHLPDQASGRPRGPREAAAAIEQAALDLGFARVGFAPAGRMEDDGDRMAAWLRRGRHAGLAYLAGPEDRAHPRALHPTAATAIVVALTHEAGSSSPAGGATVARYARGEDYHLVARRKLAELADRCADATGRVVTARVCVDTAPLLERALAVRAGIAFSGKSTMAIVPGLGTFFVLGILLVDIELPTGLPLAARCGSCTACLDACPTSAFVGPWDLDAGKCIAYLTIESQDPIPVPLRPAVGTRAFGCDVCQEVCPFNARDPLPPIAEMAPRASLTDLHPESLLTMGSAAHRKLVRRSALRRSNRTSLARNAAVALGNSGDRAHVPSLVQTTVTDSRPAVRAHAAWALGELGGDAARAALARIAVEDEDEGVRAEARGALARLGPATAPA